MLVLHKRLRARLKLHRPHIADSNNKSLQNAKSLIFKSWSFKKKSSCLKTLQIDLATLHFVADRWRKQKKRREKAQFWHDVIFVYNDLPCLVFIYVLVPTSLEDLWGLIYQENNFKRERNRLMIDRLFIAHLYTWACQSLVGVEALGSFYLIITNFASFKMCWKFSILRSTVIQYTWCMS